MSGGLPFTHSLREVIDGIDVLLVDIWGVVHNGLEAFTDASVALQNFRKQGGTVILITNAPRAADSVQRQLQRFGVPDDAYDDIVSSGDLTRLYIEQHQNQSIYWIGPERDASVHRGFDATFTTLDKADYIVCTGLFDDETETAEDYREMLTSALERKLMLVCANPDLIVERGTRILYCAGAIGDLYKNMGGEVLYYGKPHAPIYDRALELAAARRGSTPALNRILAIGDSVRTDLTGAHAYGIDMLFVARGIHSQEL